MESSCTHWLLRINFSLNSANAFKPFFYIYEGAVFYQLPEDGALLINHDAALWKKCRKNYTEKLYKNITMISICYLLRLSKYFLTQVKVIVCGCKTGRQLSTLTLLSDFFSFNLIFLTPFFLHLLNFPNIPEWARPCPLVRLHRAVKVQSK